MRAPLPCFALAISVLATPLSRADPRKNLPRLVAEGERCYKALDYACAERALGAARHIVRADTDGALFVQVHLKLAEVEAALGKLDLARAVFRDLLRAVPGLKLPEQGIGPRVSEAFALALKDVTPAPDHGTTKKPDPVKPPIALDPPIPLDPLAPLEPPHVPLGVPLPPDPFPFSVGAGFAYAFIFGNDATALENGVGFRVFGLGRAYRNLWAGLGAQFLSFKEIIALKRNVTSFAIVGRVRLSWEVGPVSFGVALALGAARSSVSTGLAATGFVVNGELAVAISLHARVSIELSAGTDLVFESVSGEGRKSLLVPLALAVAGHF